MKTNFKLMLAALAGVVIGAAGIGALSAQGVTPSKAPPAYLIAEVEVTDPDGYKTYQDGVSSLLAALGGRFVVRGGKTIALDGEPPKRIIVIAFDSMEKAQAFRNSTVYKEFVPIRDKSSKFRLFAVEGVVP
ncbi:MAG TPA: DUF1330 domain-containing protein [Candidatus Binatia bacterium]|jgi:uncharacterized protein (DUF1330 family)|nr:DUF1330 domain-containing protein [Candidatus Binatia bacterium]